jgi:hypothetical protein
MKKNLLRISKISKADNLPVERSTLYKWKHLRRQPSLFVKLGGALFVDLDVLDEIIESGRIK